MAHVLQSKKRTRPVSELISTLWSYIKKFKQDLFLVSFLILFYTLAATLQPVAIQLAIKELFLDSTSDSAIILVFVFLVLSILVWIFQSLAIWVMSKLSARMVQNLREDAFKSLVHAEMGYHHRNQSGNITARVVSDTQEISNGLNLFTSTATELFVVLGTTILLAYYNAIFLVIALIGVPLAFGINKALGNVFRKRALATRQAFGVVSAKLAENLSGVAISKSFKQEARMSKEFKEYNQSVYEKIKRLVFVGIVMMPSLAFITTVLVYVLLITGGYLYSLDNGSSISLPIFGSISIPSGNQVPIDIIFLGTILIQRFLSPITQLSQNYTQLQSSLGSMDRVSDVLAFQNSLHEVSDAQPLKVSIGRVEFNSVKFSYTDEAEVINDMSFSINGGEKIALVGKTGAGKSTIASLIMRFYDPTKGTVLVDNQDISKVSFASIYSNIGLVTQEPYIFEGTIMDNIRYGKPELTDEEAIDICKLIGAHEFIDVLPDGYNTKVQESGKSLSAGQRQMITIARVFLSDPKIVILDEATSRLDAYTEAMVQNAQNKLFEGRTTVIIAHRLSTIQDVNRIMVIDNGILEGIGTHKEMLNSNEKYRDLYNLYYNPNIENEFPSQN